MAPSNVRLGMLKLNSGFLNDMREDQKLNIKLVDQLSSVGQDGDEDFRVDESGVLKFQNKICVPDVPELKRMIRKQSHKSILSIHPRATKMYRDLKKMFWWSGMKRDISHFFYACLTCQKSKIEH